MTAIRALAAASIIVALSGCVATKPAPEDVITGAYPLSPMEREAVQVGLRNSLKDPFSAVFGDMGATKTAGGKVNVCGVVNAKNSFGGYIGTVPYLGVLIPGNAPKFIPTAMGSASSGVNEITLGMCRAVGINITF